MTIKQAVSYSLKKYKKAYEMLADYDKGKRYKGSKKITNYFDLPEKERRKIVEKAMEDANKKIQSLLESEE